MSGTNVIVPLDVPVDFTFEQLGDMIYSMIDINKQMFKLVLIVSIL